MCQTETNH